MVVGFRCICNSLRFVVSEVLLFDPTDAGLASFDLCQLLDKGPAISAAVSCLWVVVLKLPLALSMNNSVH